MLELTELDDACHLVRVAGDIDTPRVMFERITPTTATPPDRPPRTSPRYQVWGRAGPSHGRPALMIDQQVDQAPPDESFELAVAIRLHVARLVRRIESVHA
ncbi:hypothetical protein ACWFRB_16270 [Rhodococcus sp. NPDC055112]